MILIADSGSTKTDWLFFDAKNQKSFSTVGFNPLFHSVAFIKDEIVKNSNLTNVSNEVEYIYYYGAGCSSNDRNLIVKTALSEIFEKAKIVVEHDLLGAAIALCGNQKGIACILGTGSNSCYYDGNSISEITPSLGYILGDEGSGTHIGKKLITNHLYNKAPVFISEKLNNMGLTKETVLNKVYKEQNANVFLASLTKQIAEFKEDKWVVDLIGSSFNDFLVNHVLPYTESKKVSFVGSIAYVFQDVLKYEVEKLGLIFGKVESKPIQALKEYYFSKHY